MMKGSFLCAIAILGLVSMSKADSEEKFPSQAMFGANDLARMEKIKVKYCSFDEMEHRRAFCDKVTDDAYRPTCEDTFSKLVKLCDEHLDKMLAETFDPELLEDLWWKFDSIEARVIHPLPHESLRMNLEDFFNYHACRGDNEYSAADQDKILGNCHSFIVSYQPIKSFLSFSGRKSLESAGGEKAQEVFQIYEFCRAFVKQYDRESEDSDLYWDEVVTIDADTPAWLRALRGLTCVTA